MKDTIDDKLDSDSEQLKAAEKPIIGTVNLYVIMRHEDSLAGLVDAYGFSLQQTDQRRVYVVEYYPAKNKDDKDKYTLTNPSTGEEVFVWDKGGNTDISQGGSIRIRNLIGNKSDVLVHNNHYAEAINLLDMLGLDYEEFTPLKEGGRHFVSLRR